MSDMQKPMTVKKYISVGERWPHFYLEDANDYAIKYDAENIVDVPEETLNRWNRTISEFHNVQEEMRKAIKYED